MCITPRGDYQPERARGSFMLVDLQKTLAECVNGDPNDSVSLGIELWPAPQRLDCDRVLLDLICPPLEVLPTYIFQHPDKIDRAPENARGQEPIYLCLFRIGVKPCMRDKLGRLGRFHDGTILPLAPDGLQFRNREQRIYNGLQLGP